MNPSRTSRRLQMRRAGAAALRLLCALPLAACSVFTTMYATPGPHPEQHPLPVTGTDLFDWKGVVHCHSYLSHDSKGTIPEIAAACADANLDFLVMTDHQTERSIAEGTRGMVGNTLFLVGCEQRCPQGTILAFPLTKQITRWQHAGLLVKDAHAQGGLAFFCHAELWKSWDAPEADGVEIVNLHAGVLAPNKVLTLLTGITLPLRILFERICWRDQEVFRRWDAQLAARHPATPIGGGDAHASVRMLGPLGGTIGNYREVFLTLSTHALAPALTEAALVDAFRRGRSYVSFDIFGEGAGFDFRATDATGIHLPGDTVPLTPSLRLHVRTPQPGRIQVFRDGAMVREVDGDALEFAPEAPGIHRIEVRTRFGSPWLFSSTIRVAAQP